MTVAAEIMLEYVKIWAEHKKILGNLDISLCSIWIEGERRPAVRIWAFKQDIETILWLEDEKPNPKFKDTGHMVNYGTLEYYCDTGGYRRAPVKQPGLLKLYPIKINSSDKATDAAHRYALSLSRE